MDRIKMVNALAKVALKKNYTQFQLDVVLSLKSKYAKRLYEMLSQHKEIGELNISVKELKRRLKLNQEDPQQETYAQFTTLRRNVLDIAQQELQEHADIHFTYTLGKTGSKYTDLIFHIKQVDKPLQYGQTLLF